MQLYDSGTRLDILIIEIRTFLRLELVRKHLTPEIMNLSDIPLKPGKNKSACHTKMCSGWRHELTTKIPKPPLSHAANKPHMLFSNLQPDQLFDIIQIEKSTSLSLECLFSLICCKHSLREKILLRAAFKDDLYPSSNIYRKDENQNVFHHTQKKSVVF